jgi:hypothetical protein
MRAMLAAALLGLVGVGGCNVIGVVAHKALPPPRVPAAHELAEVPTAVVVHTDELVSGEQGPIDAETLLIALKRALAEQAGVTLVEAPAARQRVEVILDPPSAQETLGSDFQRGQASATVRVVDEEGVELWPEDGTPGRGVTAVTGRLRGVNPAELRRATLQALAIEVTALFHSREMRPEE